MDDDYLISSLFCGDRPFGRATESRGWTSRTSGVGPLEEWKSADVIVLFLR